MTILALIILIAIAFMFTGSSILSLNARQNKPGATDRNIEWESFVKMLKEDDTVNVTYSKHTHKLSTYVIRILDGTFRGSYHIEKPVGLGQIPKGVYKWKGVQGLVSAELY